MKTITRNLIIALLLFVSLSGCSLVYRTLLGVDATPQWLSPEKITKEFNKYQIPKDQRYILDTASYWRTEIKKIRNEMKIIKKDSLNIDSIKYNNVKSDFKDNQQPVQIRYFKKDGSAIFKMINCYVKAYPTMTWNIEECFDTFPPKTIDAFKNVKDENLPYFLAHITTTSGNQVTFTSLPKADYYALIFWNSFMIRPSKKLIKQLKKYDEENPNQKTYFLFVNNHNSEIWGLSSHEERKEIIQQISQKEK